ncbi:MAG: TrkA C-terminal domain-containing protein, partial [Chloroflexota bacterium]|nr:TrkA C-terminal domain-containing protein [Chloroflexota bacterium]
IDVTDYAELLHLAGPYRVVELLVDEKSWLGDKTLGELNLRREGVLTLGIERPDGTFLGVPPLETRVAAGDRLTLYGRSDALDHLDRRRPTRTGDLAPERAEMPEMQGVEAQEQRDPRPR